ncbi:5203_t:CDS:1, partial [Dentiscutata heterogama]
DVLFTVENLNKQDQLDPKKKWKEIREQFLLGPFLTIKRDVAKYHAHNCQILRPIRQFHRHQAKCIWRNWIRKRMNAQKKGG